MNVAAISPPGRRPHAVALARRARVLLAGVAGIIGIGALFGGYGLMRDAEGLGLSESWLAGSPFSDYRIPDLILFVVIGGGMLVTALLAVSGSRYAALSAFAMGVELVIWGTVETLVVGWHGAGQVALLGAFVVAPATVLIRTGLAAVRPRAS